MLTGRLIICIGNSWDYDPTSKHQIMRILSRHNDILWVNYHGTRRPGLNKSDWRQAVRLLFQAGRGSRPISDTMTQVTPLVLPGAKRYATRKLHQFLLVAQIRRALRKLNSAHSKPVQVWTFAPDTPFLRGKFNEECLVYYCTDEYRKFEGLDVESLARAEDELIDRADLVVACSEPLYRSRSARRNDVSLMRHGVDFDHFAKAWQEPPPCPADMVTIPKPIFGFFGLIHHWTDVQLIAEVAAKRPRYSFVLIGDCKTDVSAFREMRNVHLLGRRDYAMLPAYCAQFDAALLPFTQTEMTRNINPVKMFEYLAAGLPIISTPLPEAFRFPEAITIARTAEEFAVHCDAAPLQRDRADRKKISDWVREHTWDARVAQLSSRVQDVVATSDFSIAQPHAKAAL